MLVWKSVIPTYILLSESLSKASKGIKVTLSYQVIFVADIASIFITKILRIFFLAILFHLYLWLRQIYPVPLTWIEKKKR